MTETPENLQREMLDTTEEWIVFPNKGGEPPDIGAIRARDVMAIFTYPDSITITTTAGAMSHTRPGPVRVVRAGSILDVLALSGRHLLEL